MSGPLSPLGNLNPNVPRTPGPWNPPSFESAPPPPPEATFPAYITGGNGYSSAVLADSPKAYWRLGESAGPTAEEENNLFDGTYTSSTFSQAGALTDDPDTAVLFDGIDDVVSAPLVSTVVNNFSLECWVKLPSTSGQVATFLHNGDGGANGWGIAMHNGSGGAGLKLCGDLPFVSFNASDYSFSDTGWHHIVFCRDAGTYKMYVDGSAVGYTGASGSAPNVPTVKTAIGARPNGAGAYTQYANATVDEAAVYETALSAAQVAAHFAANGPGAITASAQSSATLDLTAPTVTTDVVTPTIGPMIAG